MSKLICAVNDTDHSKGNANASMTLVEYGDFQCPYCRRAYPLVNQLLDLWGKELRFVFRNFPVREIHPHAYVAAITAEAAGKQGKFWEAHSHIFENQDKLNCNFLRSIQEEIGLDPVKLATDLQNEKTQIKIEEDFESGMRSGVNRTPTFFLNGLPILAYDETYKSLLDAIWLECEL